MKTVLPGILGAAFVLAVLAVLAGACEDPAARAERVAKERAYKLSQLCIRKKGSPVMDGDEFKSCDYTRHYGFKKE